MNTTFARTFACAAVLAVVGAAHAQSAMSSDAAASSGKHSMKKKHGMERSKMEPATTVPPGAATQSGSVAPSTPDQMQIKNARDGSPMKTSKSGMAASGAK